MTGSSFRACAACAPPALGGRPGRRGRHEKTTNQRLDQAPPHGVLGSRGLENEQGARGRAGRGSSVLIVGLIRLVIATMAIRETIGIISPVIAVVLWVLGSMGCPRSAVLVARQRAIRDRGGRSVAVVSACDGHLEGLGLGCPTEGVVGLHEVV